MVGPPGFNDYIVHPDLQNFQGGSFRYFSKNWYKYTKDTYILDIVTKELKLELNELPSQYSRSTFPLSENEVISAEIKKLLKKEVIVHSTIEYNEFISGILTRNQFKMESLNNVLNIIRPNVYIWHPLI